jgi:hypothetical protein
MNKKVYQTIKEVCFNVKEEFFDHDLTQRIYIEIMERFFTPENKSIIIDIFNNNPSVLSINEIVESLQPITYKIQKEILEKFGKGRIEDWINFKVGFERW